MGFFTGLTASAFKEDDGEYYLITGGKPRRYVSAEDYAKARARLELIYMIGLPLTFVLFMVGRQIGYAWTIGGATLMLGWLLLLGLPMLKRGTVASDHSDGFSDRLDRMHQSFGAGTLLALLLISLAFVAGSIAMAMTSPGRAIVGYAGAGFFGIGAIVFVAALTHRNGAVSSDHDDFDREVALCQPPKSVFITKVLVALILIGGSAASALHAYFGPRVPGSERSATDILRGLASNGTLPTRADAETAHNQAEVQTDSGNVSAQDEGPYCQTRIRHSVAAIEDPTSILEVGEIFPRVTQFRVDRRTGETSYCAHGGYCYPTHAIVDGAKIPAHELIGCRFGTGQTTYPDEIIYSMEATNNTGATFVIPPRFRGPWAVSSNECAGDMGLDIRKDSMASGLRYGTVKRVTQNSDGSADIAFAFEEEDRQWKETLRFERRGDRLLVGDGGTAPSPQNALVRCPT